MKKVTEDRIVAFLKKLSYYAALIYSSYVTGVNQPLF